MPVSYNLRDKSASIHNDISEESIAIVDRMLRSGELNSIGLIDMDENLFLSLPVENLREAGINNIHCNDLAFIKSMPSLNKLSLSYFGFKKGKIPKLSTLPSITGLTQLTLENLSNLSDLPELPALKILQLLELKNESLQFLQRYSTIEDLFISGSNLRDVKYISACRNLLRLRLIDNQQFDFSELEIFEEKNVSLKFLEISHCPLLKDFRFLKAFPNLQRLSISGCKNIQSFEGVEQCNSLKMFVVGESIVRNKFLHPLKNIDNVALGLRYTKQEVADFADIFEGSIYSIWTYENKYFDYLDEYTKYFQSKFEDLVTRV